MLPYWGRLGLRLARVALAVAGAAMLGSAETHSIVWSAAASYIVFSLVMLSDFRHKSEWRFWLGFVGDLGYFALWTRLASGTWVPGACLSYSLASAVLQRGVMETAAAATATVALSRAAAPPAALALVAALYQRYLHQRISALLGRHLALRSQAQGAREAERERIAADFHDGPMQSFVGFQMRLEIVRKLLARGDSEAAAEELSQLQELGRAQVADLRRFARSMRPLDDGLPWRESLQHMIDAFQRDTRIQASFSAGNLSGIEPPAARELLQIVGEALHNVSKHSGATRVTVSAARGEHGLEVAIEDNGSGFAFTGSLNLDELDRLHAGPISIKRRIRLLEGELHIDSKPGQGAKLEIRVPV
jgi:signal transduction histidine kinase